MILRKTRTINHSISFTLTISSYLRMNIMQLERGVAALTSVANRVYEWAGDAAIKLNASKTKAIICTYRELSTEFHKTCLALR